ncbi:AHH domain-containing protein [Clostridium thailandense]|uniref:AHH domain-containing protein n=1 Tax=Clostridium thailandense TaxID=2794346 RepID=UPI003989D545
MSYKAGKVVGDIVSLIASGGEMAAGGFVLDSTGALAPVGVMANAGELVVAGDGLINASRSSKSLAEDLFSFASNGGNKGGSNSELHHIATDKSKKFDFKNHPAFKETKINVSKDIDNLVDLVNHRGRHTYKYHQEIKDRLDAVVERYGGTDKLEQAVREELRKMKQELLNGNLDPYKK